MPPSARLAAAWGRTVARRPWLVLGAWVAAVAVAAVFAGGTSRLLSAAGFETDTPAKHAADLLHDHFPERKAPVVYVVFQSGRPASDPGYQSQVAAWRQDLERAVPPGEAVVAGPLLGRDGRTLGLFVDSNQTPDRFIELAHRVRSIRHTGPAHVYLGGLGPIYDDFLVESEADLRQSEVASLPIAAALLLLVFGGVVAGALPVLTGLATVTTAVALLGAVARAHTVSVFALNVSSVVGLGLGIDYSLLVVNRFREELRAGAGVDDAVGTTVATAGVATVISGGTVAIGFGSLLLTHLNVLWSIGLGGALVVGVSILASLSLIPALLSIFGRRIDSLALPFVRPGRPHHLWRALASRVMGRPGLFIAVAVAVVGILAWPAHAFRAGVVGAESLPPEEPAVTADRLVHEQLGFSAYPPVLIVAEGVDDPAQAALFEARVRTAAGGQRVVGPSEVRPDIIPLYFRPPYAVYEVDQPGPDNSDQTHAFLDRLRGVRMAGVEVTVGGEAAAYQDFLTVLGRDFPVAFGTVLAATLVLLGTAFRSLVLPVKAVLMNLLSVAAAMGVLTWVFQEGHLARQLDFQAVGFVDATIPVIIFAGLFGLSMDYEVFLLSRVREEWLAVGDNQAAVAAGMEKTGQVITSAALILVPALMRVLGAANWWPGAYALPPDSRDRIASASDA